MKHTHNHPQGTNMSSQPVTDNYTPTVNDIDEALMYAALTNRRGPTWDTWVDQLLDERNKLQTRNNKTQTNTQTP